MQLHITVLDPRDPRPVDVRIDAPVGASMRSVRDAAAALLPRPFRHWYAGGRALTDADIVGVQPLVEGAVITLDRPAIDTAQPTARAGTLLELHVLAGPAAGVIHALPAGRSTIGRSRHADIRIPDPAVSRLHALVTVGATGLLLRDLGSVNGTAIDGASVGEGQPQLAAGQHVRIGDTTLRVVVAQQEVATWTADGQGARVVNRPPRITSALETPEIGWPAPPPDPPRPGFPVVATVVPLLFTVPLVALFGTHMLAFGLLAPAMALAALASDHVTWRRRRARDLALFHEAVRAARNDLDRATAAEVARRQAEAPDAATLLRTATAPSPRVWERRLQDDDALALRVGTADLRARVRLSGAPPEDLAGGAGVREVPVVVPLADVGVLGIAGPADLRAGLGRFLLSQIATLHCPRDVSIVLLQEASSPPTAPGGSSWQWVRWLPHTRPHSGQACDRLVGVTSHQVERRVEELLALVDARSRAERPAGTGSWSGPVTVVVLDGACALRRRAGVTRLLTEGPRVGVYALCFDDHPAALPAECRATITLSVGCRLTISQPSRPPVDGAVPDLVSADYADRLARGLAPLRDGAQPVGPDAGLPKAVSLLALLDMVTPSGAAVKARWDLAGVRAAAVVGVDASGAVTVDLDRDGPHALVAGTTGSGKSELLRTLVASLAASCPPDKVALCLVDYKGGSAFRECARLPHCVGLVTDLDNHLTARALTSLNAEIRRRERLLAEVGADDFAQYHELGLAADEPLPRLLIVVDEFAALTADLPDFVAGLVDIAARGRSLGVHLVLATQRPAGAVSADIRANTALRIALRLTGAAESLDVLDSNVAAAIPKHIPGRAFLRVGSDAVTDFQVAQVGRLTHQQATSPASVTPVPWEALGDPPSPASDATDPDAATATDLTLLVDAVLDAVRECGVRTPASPWLPPLPEVVLAADLTEDAPDRIPLGLGDLPALQQRAAVSLDLSAARGLLVAGAPRSGRSSMLRTLAAVAAGRHGAHDLHLYGFDMAGVALRSLRLLPHCGAVIGRDETQRGRRLLEVLGAEVARRQALLADAGCAALSEHRARTSGRDRLPWMLLLVDGLGEFVASYESVDAGTGMDLLVRLVREGPAVGLVPVVTGDRSVLLGPVGAALADRLLLRMVDPLDYALAGLAPSAVPDRMPPGRALLCTAGSDPVEVQVAVRGDGLAAAPTWESAVGLPPWQRPLRVEPLPRTLHLSEIPAASTQEQHSPLSSVIGVGGDAASALRVDLAAAAAFVVAGRPGSGRSSTLATLGRGLRRNGVRIALVAAHHGAMQDLVMADHRVGVDDAAAATLRDLVLSTERAVAVLVDDAETLLDTPVEQEICRALHEQRGAASGPGAGVSGVGSGARVAVVVAGSAEAMLGTYRGLTVAARRYGHGLLLGPGSPLDGDLLGVRRLPADAAAPPGRGVLVQHGTLTPVQVADPRG